MNRLMTVRAVILTGLMLVGTLAFAAPSRDDVIDFLGRVYTEEGLRRELTGHGFRGENLALSMAHVRRVMNDRVVTGAIADRLIAAGQGKLEPTGSADGFLMPIVERGLTRLPAPELSYYYKVEATVFKALPTRECGLELKGRLHPAAMSHLAANATSKLNTPALKEYYRIVHKAARLGATRKPVQLGQAEQAKRGKRLFAAMQAEAAKRSNGAALMRAYENEWKVSNAVACEAGLLLFDTILTLPAGERHRMLVMISQ
ncbi:hypothetical protein KO498_07095 [Lentibacter algarum]|uniref:hypothetical protein n=1 Tax=Lentibacter algarum TaxID=576131 RepID=UPI001C07315A|nr:hypothetical protein [Lentibacter algarum]MBU2981580.1 hypothetical protein [Lentibacter algarum]